MTLYSEPLLMGKTQDDMSIEAIKLKDVCSLEEKL